MSERAMRDVREMLCRELDDIARKPELSQNAVDYVQKVTSSIKNLDKILMYEKYKDDGSYHDDGSYDGGYSSRRYRDGNGRYSSYGDRSYMNDGRSWGEVKDTMIQQLTDMMARAGTDREKDVIRKARDELKAM